MSKLNGFVLVVALLAAALMAACGSDDSSDSDAGVDSGPVDLCAPLVAYYETCGVTGGDLAAAETHCQNVQTALIEGFTTEYVACVTGVDCAQLVGGDADAGATTNATETCYWNTSGTLDPPQANEDLADMYCQFMVDCVSVDQQECLDGWKSDDPASLFLAEEYVTTMTACLEPPIYCGNDYSDVNACVWDVIESLDLFDTAE